jgi:phosphate transport system ATP-binding protein
MEMSYTTVSPSSPSALPPPSEIVLQTHTVGVAFQGATTLEAVDLNIYKHQVTSIIGPSGCGKSTLLRCFNRLNELIPGATVTGEILLSGRDLRSLHPVEVRRRVGMVFQKPNPFPKSVYDNIAIGLQVNGYRSNIDARVESALQQVGLWDEVKDKLKKNAAELSGGQQQRLCLARAIALNPDVLLMDEPCSALDPIATTKIEKLIHELRSRLTVVIVTHNMQQATRLSDYTAFFSTNERGVGHLVEFGTTYQIFRSATQKKTREYVEGRFG